MQDRSSKDRKTIPASVTLNLTPPEVSSEACTFSIDASNFQPKPQKKVAGVSDCVIIGFDTEYVTPDSPSSRDDIREGRAKYRVLSYQFHCLLPSGEAWSGIAIPSEDERMSMGELVVFALGSRPQSQNDGLLPRSIYLVGHYTKADLPAFSDFDSIKKIAAAVRSSFVSTDASFDFVVNTTTGEIELCVLLRDTFLLAPAGSQALAALGEILAIPKVTLHDDPAEERRIKGRMDELRSRDWPLFRKYAIQDAVICAEYAQRIIRLCELHLGKPRLPVTLTAIGVDLLLKKWRDESRDADAILGREVVKEKRWNKRRGHYQTESREVARQNYALYEQLATEAYHGGRNEQYWFGPAFVDDWTDFDLSSAYATGMALIGTPDWSDFKHTLAVTDFGIQTLGYALVDFEFPATVRFPSLPVRTDNGLIFPRKGQSFCAAPEIALANALGAKLTIKHGVVVASDSREPVFASYIRHCITERRKYPKKSLDDLFWKELSNSTYGKTAQGLREKRVYDSRSMDMVPLPPSKITNPYFAAYITSFVRAVIGEILNALPDRVCVFSCTTDGFLTNATKAEIDTAVQGPTANAFKETRDLLTGEPTVLEVKHRVRCPLGWRTRGQATLIEGTLEQKPTNIVLAKGGLRLDDGFDTLESRNAEIVRMFFARTPEDRLTFESLTGIRDIIEFDTDLVWKEVSRRVNMEYDWKRKPDILFDHEDYKHCAFSTVPWETVDQFIAVRGLFEKYLDSDPHCIRSVGDLDSFSVYVDSQMQLSDQDRRYLRKRSGDLSRLRKALCAAWHMDLLGLRKNPAIRSAQQFADLFTACGVGCSRANVENGSKQSFTANSIPPTESVLAAIAKLNVLYPDLVTETLCATHHALATVKPRRRPHLRLHTRGDWYYRGITIPGIGRIEPALQPSWELKRIFEQPRDYVDPPRRWLTRQEYGLHD
ncbi:DNA polymerase [Bradyrhizobium sp. ma5]|uniref:DNA polymerase n=1 Tax=Bradyrhizobium sp. ma5 TaxID=3344828 RepID=UPI0035D45BFB